MDTPFLTNATEPPTVGQLAISRLRESGLGDVLYFPGEEAFEARMRSYWSLSPRLRPWAVVQPRTTDEVSRAVVALVGTPGCQFAIRSGGHMSWPGANGITSGVTVDLGLMDKTTYDPETKIASLQPGPRWTDVYAALEKEGVMVAGGREGLVGVAGLLLGGGISYYSCRLGLACDQVVNYEVVLADGEIVDANEGSNEDLFRALKGGGNNFGIVTRFDMKTFPAHDVWDGIIIHPKSETDAVIDAFVDLTDNLNVAANPADHFLGMWTYTPQAKDVFVMSVLTQLDAVENPPSMEKFLAIPGQKNMKRMSMASKVAEFLVPSNKYDIWLTCNFKNDKRIAKKAIEVFQALVDHIKAEHVPSGEFTAYTVLQALPASFGRHSAARGGNMLGLERVPFGAAVLDITCVQLGSWALATAVRPRLEAAVAALEAHAAALGGAVEFRYGNYCDGLAQDPLATYGGENIRRMRAAAERYDPAGVFQTRVPGGYKISRVNTKGEGE